MKSVYEFLPLGSEEPFIAVLAERLIRLLVVRGVRQHESARVAEAVLNGANAEVIILVGKPGHNRHASQCYQL